MYIPAYHQRVVIVCMLVLALGQSTAVPMQPHKALFFHHQNIK